MRALRSCVAPRCWSSQPPIPRKRSRTALPRIPYLAPGLWRRGLLCLAITCSLACSNADRTSVSAVAVAPHDDTLLVGERVRLLATLRGPPDRPFAGRSRITWSTSNSSVARVSADGEVTAAGVGVASISASAANRAGSARISVSYGGGVVRDVHYCSPNPLRTMNVHIPGAARPRPLPVAVYIHGGGWDSGDKDHTDWRFAHVRDSLLSRGYVVANLNYRLAPADKWPAQIEDVKCAIRDLRANALIFGLDPSRVVAWGTSAGSHLAAMLGTTGRDPQPTDTGEFAGFSSRVSAVVDIAGPTDLGRPGELNFGGVQEILRTWPDSSSAEAAGASPVHQVSAQAPPFYIIHGDRDEVVKLDQAVRLYDRLGAMAVPRQMLVVLNATHGIASAGEGILPDRPAIVSSIVAFFDRYTSRP